MAENEEPGFDPRFDPAFQRGFDTVSANAAPSDARRRHSATVSGAPPVAAPSSYGAHPPERPREIGIVPPPAAPASAPTTPGSTAGAPAIEYGAADDAADDPRRPWRNPFLIALAVVSIALVGAGVWLAQQAREPFLGTDANVQADYMTLQMMMTAAPLVVVAGLATAVGVVFFLAADWQRRR